MVLWRISNHADLLGTGGMLAPARWHTAGRPVVYLAESAAGALLEVLVHLEVDEAHMPTHFQLLKVEADEGIATEHVEKSSLSEAWSAREGETQARGELWLRGGTSALLRVPSALVPETANWLLNPRHGEARRVQVVAAWRVPFDPRLL